MYTHVGIEGQIGRVICSFWKICSNLLSLVWYNAHTHTHVHTHAQSDRKGTLHAHAHNPSNQTTYLFVATYHKGLISKNRQREAVCYPLSRGPKHHPIDNNPKHHPIDNNPQHHPIDNKGHYKQLHSAHSTRNIKQQELH